MTKQRETSTTFFALTDAEEKDLCNKMFSNNSKTVLYLLYILWVSYTLWDNKLIRSAKPHNEDRISEMQLLLSGNRSSKVPLHDIVKQSYYDDLDRYCDCNLHLVEMSIFASQFSFSLIKLLQSVSWFQF